MNTLALFEQALGRYAEAEELLKQAFQTAGELDQSELKKISQNNLAALYHLQFQLEEAIDLLVELESPISGGNLIQTYLLQGQYGQAELFLNQERLGSLSLLLTQKNLVSLYLSQGRYQEAKERLIKIFPKEQKKWGERHPSILMFAGYLAYIEHSLGNLTRAEEGYQEVLSLSKIVFGELHPKTLAIQNNFFVLKLQQKKFEEAKLLIQKESAELERSFPKNHLHALLSLHNLAKFYIQQNEFDQAEKIYNKLIPQVQGAKTFHPYHVEIQLAYVQFLIVKTPTHKTNHLPQIIEILQKLESNLLDYAAEELYALPNKKNRREFLRSFSLLQDFAFSLTKLDPYHISKIHHFAAEISIRWHQLETEELRWISSLLNSSKDPRLLQIKQELDQARSQYSHIVHQTYGSKKENQKKESELLKKLELRELELAKISQEYKYQSRLEIKKRTISRLLIEIPKEGVLLQFKEFRSISFEYGEYQRRELALIVLNPNETEEFKVQIRFLGSLVKLQKIPFPSPQWLKDFLPLQKEIFELKELFISSRWFFAQNSFQASSTRKRRLLDSKAEFTSIAHGLVFSGKGISFFFEKRKFVSFRGN